MRKAALALLVMFLPVAGLAAVPKKPPPTPEQKLNQLFGDLAKAEDEEDASSIEDSIEKLFLQSGSPTVDLLMGRAEVALKAENAGAARKLIDSVTRIAPNYAEGWHRLAALQARDKDDRGAMLSLEKTIKLNPRHFTAHAELAGFLDDYGDKPGALKLYRRALALDPKLEEAEHAVRRLSREVEGEGI
jgi:tetratricopeptide (TPR) repeat protein